MDSFLETQLDPLLTTIFVVMVGFALVQGGRTVVADLTRRRLIRELAESRHWRFAGYVASDGRDPYTRFEQVAWAVLLRYVVEGRERGFDFSVFEYCARRRVWNTGVLVQLDVAPQSCRVQLGPGREHSSLYELEEVEKKVGPRTVAALRKGLGAVVVEIGSGAVLVRADRPPLEADEIPAFLETVLSLAGAVVADEGASSASREA